MFAWGEGCKHTVFLALRASQAAGSTGNRQHREQAAQGTGSTGDRQHRETGSTGSTGRQGAQGDRQHQSILHNLFTVAHSFTSRAFCTICSQRHAAHSLRASCLP